MKSTENAHSNGATSSDDAPGPRDQTPSSGIPKTSRRGKPRFRVTNLEPIKHGRGLLATFDLYMPDDPDLPESPIVTCKLMQRRIDGTYFVNPPQIEHRKNGCREFVDTVTFSSKAAHAKWSASALEAVTPFIAELGRCAE